MTRPTPVWRDTAAAAAALARGRVLLLPTDTLPGLHARCDRPAALIRIALLKGRAVGRPFLCLAADRESALCRGRPGDRRGFAYLNRCWPGPFTFVLRARTPDGATGVPASVVASAPRGVAAKTLAVRVPGVAALRELIRAAGAPLVSTSANRSGAAPPVTLAAAWQQWCTRVDGTWDRADEIVAAARGASRPRVSPKASAIIDLTAWPPRTLRRGSVPVPPWQDLV